MLKACRFPKSLCNYSLSFVNGIKGSCLKKDIIKNSKSDMHKKAVSISRGPRSMEDYKSTPICRALAGASREEMLCV